MPCDNMTAYDTLHKYAECGKRFIEINDKFNELARLINPNETEEDRYIEHLILYEKFICELETLYNDYKDVR